MITLRPEVVFDGLRHALGLYVTSKLAAAYGERWRDTVAPRLRFTLRETLDLAALLSIVLTEWSLFQPDLGSITRSYVNELREYRNRWAHQESIEEIDIPRLVDTATRLLRAAGMPAPAEWTQPQAGVPSAERPARLVQGTGTTPMTQRDAMRRIWIDVDGSAEQAITRYSDAERNGDVKRLRNESDLSPEAYARALLQDGLKKGWLPFLSVGPTDRDRWPRIAIIACTAAKLAGRHRARELYTQSKLFSLSMMKAHEEGLPFLIVSSLYGVVLPDKEIESYERDLKTMTRHELGEWQTLVQGQLSSLLTQHGVQEVTFFAGQDYRRLLLPMLKALGVDARLHPAWETICAEVFR